MTEVNEGSKAEEMTGSEFFTSNSELEVKLKSHLENWDVVSARRELDLPEHAEWLSRNAWELVPIVCSFLTEEMREKCPALIQACQDILIVVAERGVAKETVITLLEHVEAFTDNIKFRKVLPCLSLVLRKLNPKSRLLTWSWTFNTVYSHMSGSYQMPDSLLLSSKERLLYDNDANVKTLTDTVEDLLLFTLPLVDEAEKSGEVALKRDVIVFILQLMNKPLSYLNIRLDEETKNKSRIRVCMEKFIDSIFRLEPNPIKLCYLEEERTVEKLRRNNNSSLSSMQDDERISDYSIGTLMAGIFGEDILLEKLPQIYHFQFLLNELLLPYVVKLISHKHEMMVIKGLKLFDGLIRRVPEGTVDGSVLESSNHTKFLKCITDVIIYHDSREYRSLAYQNFDNYFKALEIQGRYTFFNYVFEISNHSGLIGIMITKLKDTILLVLRDYEEKGVLNEKFTGNSLKMLLKKFCKLSHGAESDLLEVSDEVSSALNSLYVLFKKDAASNITGIWDLKDELYEGYVKQIETGISLSKAHVKLKLNEEDKNLQNGPEVNLMVGGQRLPNMSKNEMKKVLNSAVFTLEMMEIALIRLKETLEAK